MLLCVGIPLHRLLFPLAVATSLAWAGVIGLCLQPEPSAPQVLRLCGAVPTTSVPADLCPTDLAVQDPRTKRRRCPDVAAGRAGLRGRVAARGHHHSGRSRRSCTPGSAGIPTTRNSPWTGKPAGCGPTRGLSPGPWSPGAGRPGAGPADAADPTAAAHLPGVFGAPAHPPGGMRWGHDGDGRIRVHLHQIPARPSDTFAVTAGQPTPRAPGHTPAGRARRLAASTDAAARRGAKMQRLFADRRQANAVRRSLRYLATADPARRAKVVVRLAQSTTTATARRAHAH